MDKYYIRNPKNEVTSGVPLNTKYPHVNRNATSNFILTCKNKNVKPLREADNSKIYYHGSNAKFTQFDKSKIRQNKLGLAFNFTDDYSMAYQYGNNIIKAHLDLNNPITEEVLSSPWTYEQDEMLAKIMGFPRRSREDWENTNETFGDVYNVFKQYPKFIKVLQNLGYDGLAFPEDHHYGVFEPEQIHIIDDLTEAQISLDIDVNKITWYHGTSAYFDKFTLDHFGKTDCGFLGKGIYLTNNYTGAEYYGHGYGKYNPEAHVYKCKVNVKNPYIITGEAYSCESNKLASELGVSYNPRITDKLQQQGYDSVLLYNTSSYIGDQYELCVFNPDNVQIIETVKESIDFVKLNEQLKQYLNKGII